MPVNKPIINFNCQCRECKTALFNFNPEVYKVIYKIDYVPLPGPDVDGAPRAHPSPVQPPMTRYVQNLDRSLSDVTDSDDDVDIQTQTIANPKNQKK